MKKLPSKDTLDKMFKIDGSDLIRKVDAPGGRFKAGTIAGSLDGRGYVVIVINGIPYKAHRLVWKMINGFDPEYIDHINGDRTDNRICNLRSVKGGENNKNCKLRTDNKGNRIGVNWHKASGKYTAQIGVDGKKIYLGVFNNKEKAILARISAEKKYGFHENHGRT